MRVLHVADLHLGQVYGRFDRSLEHEVVLGQILAIVERRRVDALIVAGDVFHRVHPPAGAVRMWYRFLSEARRVQPTLEVVAVAGNHDPVARFEVAEPFARPQGIELIARLPRLSSGELDGSRLLVPLHDAAGVQRAVCVAVPFLRPADLRSDPSQPGWQRAGIEAVYAEAFELARAAVADDGANLGIVATGHLEVAGTAVFSEAELRTPFDGADAPKESALFPKDVSYVALGHVHLPQAVAGRENVRYSGSPLPLSMSEVGYAHQAVLVELDAQGNFAGYESCELQPPVEMIRVPSATAAKGGAAGLAEVLEELETRLAPQSASNVEQANWPYVAVHVRDEPGATEPLRVQIEAAVADKVARLVQIRCERERTKNSTAATPEHTSPATEPHSLAELDPEEVFALCYQEAHGDEATQQELPTQMRTYLRELIAEARNRDRPDHADEELTLGEHPEPEA